MKNIYAREWYYFKKNYSLPFFLVLIISIIVSVLAYFSLLSQPELAMNSMESLQNAFQQKGIDINKEMSNYDMFIVVLKNNLFVSFMMVLLGLIPLIILPSMSAVMTSVTISILLAFVKLTGGEIGGLFTFGILPHGIFEITGILAASAIGIYLSRSIALKLFSRRRDEIQIGHVFLQTGRSFILVVVPLIVVAAVVEGYVTPELVRLFVLK